MNHILPWGLELIRAVQRFRSPALDALFIAITSLGSEDFYFLLLPVLLWCVDFAVGARIAAALLLSTYANAGLKDLFALPRPFELDPAVQVYDVAGYGLPSGHAQHSVVIWGTIAHAWRAARGWILAGLLALLIGFSRIYLGVHFPTDVLAGWLIGILLLAPYVAFHRRLEGWLEGRELGAQLTAAVVLPLLLLSLHVTEDTTSLTGVLLGAGLGIALLRRSFHYDAGGPPWQRAFRLFLGIAVVLALRFGLKAISPHQPEALRLTARFLRYAILGVWISLGAPWLFKTLRLTPGQAEEPAMD